MRFHVTIKTFDSFTGEEKVQALQQAVGQKIQDLQASEKLVDGGSFVDMRGGYFVIDADSATELLQLLSPMHDYARIELHPLISFETLGAFFQGAL